MVAHSTSGCDPAAASGSSAPTPDAAAQLGARGAQASGPAGAGHAAPAVEVEPQASGDMADVSSPLESPWDGSSSVRRGSAMAGVVAAACQVPIQEERLTEIPIPDAPSSIYQAVEVGGWVVAAGRPARAGRGPGRAHTARRAHVSAAAGTPPPQLANPLPLSAALRLLSPASPAGHHHCRRLCCLVPLLACPRRRPVPAAAGERPGRPSHAGLCGRGGAGDGAGALERGVAWPRHAACCAALLGAWASASACGPKQGPSPCIARPPRAQMFLLLVQRKPRVVNGFLLAMLPPPGVDAAPEWSRVAAESLAVMSDSEVRAWGCGAGSCSAPDKLSRFHSTESRKPASTLSHRRPSSPSCPTPGCKPAARIQPVLQARRHGSRRPAPLATPPAGPERARARRHSRVACAGPPAGKAGSGSRCAALCLLAACCSRRGGCSRVPVSPTCVHLGGPH